MESHSLALLAHQRSAALGVSERKEYAARMRGDLPHAPTLDAFVADLHALTLPRTAAELCSRFDRAASAVIEHQFPHKVTSRSLHHPRT
jgi:hypothetical protein